MISGIFRGRKKNSKKFWKCVKVVVFSVIILANFLTKSGLKVFLYFKFLGSGRVLQGIFDKFLMIIPTVLTSGNPLWALITHKRTYYQIFFTLSNSLFSILGSNPKLRVKDYFAMVVALVMIILGITGIILVCVYQTQILYEVYITLVRFFYCISIHFMKLNKWIQLSLRVMIEKQLIYGVKYCYDTEMMWIFF